MYMSPVKYSTAYVSIVVIVIVVLIGIMISAASKSSVQPYGLSGYAKFEGFVPHTSYSTYPGNQSVDQKVKYDIVPSKAPYQPVWGLGGLFGPPNATGNAAYLDMYSNAQGSLSLQCMNTSSGYSNSKGYLCLNPEQIQMLKTRGGNQTVCGSQIGGGCNA